MNRHPGRKRYFINVIVRVVPVVFRGVENGEDFGGGAHGICDMPAPVTVGMSRP